MQLPVDTIYAPDSQIQCNHRHLITNERDTCSFHRPWDLSRASRDILGYFKRTRLHRVFTSTLVSIIGNIEQPWTGLILNLAFKARSQTSDRLSKDSYVPCHKKRFSRSVVWKGGICRLFAVVYHASNAGFVFALGRRLWLTLLRRATSTSKVSGWATGSLNFLLARA